MILLSSNYQVDKDSQKRLFSEKGIIAPKKHFRCFSEITIICFLNIEQKFPRKI